MPGLLPYETPQSYNTQLGPLDELAFRQWVTQNRVPFDLNAIQSDYDMRGFYRALQQQNPMAQTAVNPNDAMLHYPDFWKTPLHQSFSNESQWAGPNAPQWINQSQLASPSGRIVFDERAQPPFFAPQPPSLLGAANRMPAMPGVNMAPVPRGPMESPYYPPVSTLGIRG